MARRRKWPAPVETAVLTKSGRRCCLCFGLHDDTTVKRGQLAHVDHDRSNTAFENAAFLCIPHHDEYDSTPSQSKGITPAELAAYRQRLYHGIEEGAFVDDDEPPPPTIKLYPAFNTNTGDKSTVINAAGDVNFNPRITRKNVVQPGPAHVSSEQALEIRTRIIEVAELEAKSGRKLNPGRWYNKLYEAFGVTSYLLTPAERYADVIVWLQQQAALLRPKLRRTNKPAWRGSLYTAIWARAREVGMSKEAVYEFAATVLGLNAAPESLKDLGEMNLKRVYDAFFRRTRG